jgi:DNA-binding NtrC family response regulator
MMLGLLIADKDMDSRKQMADLLIDAGYNVTVTNSAADALYGILKKTAQVVLLSGEFDDLTAVDLIPLMKKCNRDLTIILVSDEVTLQQIRRVRREGIFYHALKPVKMEDREEIRQAVRCAFDTVMTSQGMRKAG